MGKVYWNYDEIPIPSEAYTNTSDGRVYIKQVDESGKQHRLVIGHASSQITMTPNDAFKALYPGQWEKHYGAKDLFRYEIHVGMYALTLGVGLQSGVYPILQNIYGLANGNAIMDYAMFSILERCNTTQLFQERMEDSVLFSTEALSDSWYSNLFSTKLNDQMHFGFKIAWINHCKTLGIRKIWVSIDGSNNDCEVKASELCEYGKNKSHNKNKTMVSYIEAVSAIDGMPVTYFVNEGGVVDCKAFQELITFLKVYEFEIEGVIMDRGFCTPDIIHTLQEYNLNYVIMLPQDTKGFKETLARNYEAIRWKPRYLVNPNGVFGIAEEGKIWAKHKDKAFINLFFSGANGSIHSIQLIQKICKEMENAEKSIAIGRNPVIDKSLEKYFDIAKDNNGRITSISYDYEEWESSLNTKGYFGMISSLDYGPKKVYEINRLRDNSETQFSILKSQEGFDVTRVHTTPGIKSKFAVGFLTSILRHGISSACKRADLDTNYMIRKINRIKFMLTANGIYTPIRKYLGDQIRLLEAVNIQPDDFILFAQEYNKRLLNPIHSQKHRIPEHVPVIKKGRGRQKGSKNKTTIAKEAEIERAKSEGTYHEPIKRSVGRPVGSKDSKPRKRRNDAGIKRKQNK